MKRLKLFLGVIILLALVSFVSADNNILNCKVDADCPVGNCPDNSTYKAFSCYNNQCTTIMYFANPCMTPSNNYCEDYPHNADCVCKIGVPKTVNNTFTCIEYPPICYQRDNLTCCMNDDCITSDYVCQKGTKFVSRGCDENCSLMAGCEPISTNFFQNIINWFRNLF